MQKKDVLSAVRLHEVLEWTLMLHPRDRVMVKRRCMICIRDPILNDFILNDIPTVWLKNPLLTFRSSVL
jgi:hypothetical protein